MAWDRDEVYEYPAMVDRLPKGAVIWNPQGGPVNYVLAGASLTNKVIATGWTDVQSALTILRDHEIDYVVYRRTKEFALDMRLKELGGQRVFADKVGPTHTWEIWDMRDARGAPK